VVLCSQITSTRIGSFSYTPLKDDCIVADGDRTRRNTVDGMEEVHFSVDLLVDIVAQAV
jgi:hypothetical protein